MGRTGYLKRLRDKKRKQPSTDNINNSMTNDEAYCYLGRYPNIANKVGRLNFFEAKKHWITEGKYKNLDKSCPYTVSSEDYDKRSDTLNNTITKLDEINTISGVLNNSVALKNKSITNLEGKIKEYNYIKDDKIYNLDYKPVTSNIEGFESIGLVNYLNNLQNLSADVDDKIEETDMVLERKQQEASFIQRILNNIQTTHDTLTAIEETSSSQMINTTQKIREQNQDIDNIIIENTENQSKSTYKNGLYIFDDSVLLQDFNKYYLFWVYFVLFIIISSIFISKLNKANNMKIYLFIFILAIYPFTINIIQKFGYNIISKLYYYTNSNIYTKT
jgi:lipopolysaccharide export LptBFGC system permease protein LptF